MDTEKIRKALDHFEDDEFTDAKEILQQEIRDARDKYLDTKLDLDEKCGMSHKKKKVEEQEEDEEETKKKKKKNGDMEDENEE